MKNTFVKVLSMMMALMMIVGMFGMITVSAAGHVHTPGEVIDTEPATCVSIGYTIYKCADCKQQYTDDVVMPSDEFHKIENFDPVDADCTTNAFSAGKKCKYCPYVPAGSTRVEYEGTQKQHSFKRTPVAATCSEPAKIEYVCSGCGFSAEEILEKGFDWVGGQTYGTYEVEITGPATDANHENLDWKIVVEPKTGAIGTPCATGLAEGECASCHIKKTAVLPAPHEWDEADGATKLNPTGSTCSEYKSGTACKYCKTASPDAVKFTAEEKTEHCVGSAAKVRFDGIIDANNLPKLSNGQTITLKMLEKFELFVGMDMKTDPTCTTTGLQLVECVCGELKYVVLPALGHTYNNSEEYWKTVTNIVWATKCDQDSVKIQECTYPGCDAYITKTIQEGVAHTYDVITVHPTCDSVGFTYKKCTAKFTIKDGTVEVTCGHETAPYDYKDATNHNYGPVQLKEGALCTDADGYIQKCTNRNLNEKGTPLCDSDPIPAAKPANAAHSMSDWQIEAGNCVTKSRQYKQCANCSYRVYNNDFAGDFDPNTHVLVHKGWVKDVVPTCTTGATEIVWCVSCAANDSDTIAYVERAANTKVEGVYDATHNFAAKYAEIKSGVVKSYGTHEGAVAATYGPATCQRDSYEMDGEYCVRCAAVKTPATKITKEEVAKDIANHNDKTPEVLASGTATCQVKAWVKYNTTCCGIVTIESGEKEGHNYQYVGFVAPTCTTAGRHDHKECIWCGLDQAGTTTTAGCTLTSCTNHNEINQQISDYYEIAPLGHKMTTKDAVPAVDCVSTSKDAYTYCERCVAYRVYKGTPYVCDTAKKIADFETLITLAPHFNEHKFTQSKVESSCSQYGKNAGTWCSVCDKAPEGQLDPWIMDKKPHTNNTFYINASTDADYDCTKMSAVVSTCMKCGHHEATYSVAQNPNGHNYEKYTVGSNNNSIWTAPYTKNEAPHCAAPNYVSKNCLNCNVADEEKLNEAAVGHGDAYGKFSLDCDKIAEYAERTCTTCGVGVKDMTPVHNMETNIQPATCDADGYKITFCRGCNAKSLSKTEIDEQLTEDGEHTQGTIIEYIPATESENGSITFVCTVCTAHAKELKPESGDVVVTKIIPATASLVVSGAVSANKVTASNDVTYTVTYSGVAKTYTTLKIEVEYDANKFDFVEASSALTDNVFTSVDNGVVGITLVSKTDMPTTAEGTAVVTLKFTAKKYAMGNATFGVKDNDDTVAATTVVGLGNATGTGYVTAEDALAILSTEEFNAEFDINGDGMVDLIDVALVGTFAASAQTAKDYLVMLGTYAEIQATIDALYENGRLADCNKDGIVTINDYYALTAEVDEALADLGAYTNINFASVEEFVMNTMRGMI